MSETEVLRSFRVKCPWCLKMVHMEIRQTPEGGKFFLCPECDRVADRREGDGK
jgi:endogenous inhibitor of DNA gyrase (YacG/DUF329 family)